MPSPQKAFDLSRIVAIVVGGAMLVGGARWITDRRAEEKASPFSGDELASATDDTTTTTSTTVPTTTTIPPVTLQPLQTEDGMAPVITRVETTDPVVFLTIDDGFTRTAEGLAEFERLGMPASLFLVNSPIEQDSGFFAAMPGTLVESHSQTHSNFYKLSEDAQREEICGNADRVEAYFGRRAVLFRPPFGNWNESTRRAAADCGMRAVVLWQQNVNNDVIGFREVQQFRPGDIILMHFRDSFIQELNIVKQRVEEAGLRFALLEDYIAPDSVPAGLARRP